MLQGISFIATIVVAIWGGIVGWSPWWILLPSFFTGSFGLANGPGFDLVMTANREGRLGTFPFLLFGHTLPIFLFGLLLWWITGLFM